MALSQSTGNENELTEKQMIEQHPGEKLQDKSVGNSATTITIEEIMKEVRLEILKAKKEWLKEAEDKMHVMFIEEGKRMDKKIAELEQD